jgi:hypothetical protein
MEVAGQYANLIRHKSNTMKWDPGLHTNAEDHRSKPFVLDRAIEMDQNTQYYSRYCS